jgi:putative ABC transport system permease protein
VREGTLVRILARLTDRTLAESMAGDLEEQRCARGPGIRATVWYGTALAGLVGSILVHRIRKPARWLTPGRGLNPRREVQQALRSLWSARWFSAAVVTVIALSMALAATVWAIVDGVLFKAVPYPSADQLYAITAWTATRGEPTRRMSFVAPADVRAWMTAIPDDLLTAFTVGGLEMIGENESARSVQVDARFFDVLGVTPMVGGFQPSHFAARTPIRPVVLTHAFWQRRFGGDRAVVGRTFVDSRRNGIEVVGILPPGFVFPHWSTAVQPSVLTPSIDVPETSDDAEGRSHAALVRLTGRGAGSVVDAVRRLTAAARDRAASKAGRGERMQSAFDRVQLDPIRFALTQSVRPTSWTVFAIATALLVLACLNVTGLGVARVRDRSRDLELRRALGAGTRDLVRLLLIENGLIVAAGATLGIGLAYPMLDMTLAVMPALMLLKTPVIDLRIVLFAGLASALCLMAVTLWPARTIASVSLRTSLADAGGTTRRARRGRTALVTAQVALALVMTIGGALLVGSLARVWAEDTGFDVDRHAIVSLDPPEDTSAATVEELIAGLGRVPGVERAGGLDGPLLANAFNGSIFEPPPGVVERTTIESMSITTGFLEAAGLLPVDGRLPSAQEFAQGSAVIVVSDLVAREYWPGRRAIDQVLMRQGRPFTVVGVVPDARYVSLDREPQGAIYMPFAADAEATLTTVLLAVKQGAPVRPTEIVDHVKRSCPVCAIHTAQTMTEAMGRSIRIRQFRAWLFAALGIGALVIVGTGILGLVAMTTSRRTKEIGIRMSIGATRGDVLRLLLYEQVHGVLIGLASGGLIASWAVRFVAAYLYETPVYDPFVWAASILVLVAVALVGTLVPASRASRIDPVRALRVE